MSMSSEIDLKMIVINQLSWGFVLILSDDFFVVCPLGDRM